MHACRISVRAAAADPVTSYDYSIDATTKDGSTIMCRKGQIYNVTTDINGNRTEKAKGSVCDLLSAEGRNVTFCMDMQVGEPCADDRKMTGRLVSIGSNESQIPTFRAVPDTACVKLTDDLLQRGVEVYMSGGCPSRGRGSGSGVGAPSRGRGSGSGVGAGPESDAANRAPTVGAGVDEALARVNSAVADGAARLQKLFV